MSNEENITDIATEEAVGTNSSKHILKVGLLCFRKFLPN